MTDERKLEEIYKNLVLQTVEDVTSPVKVPRSCRPAAAP
jgi:hypothetical protein